MWERTVRVGGTILLAFVVALTVDGCAQKVSGAPTARAAAHAFVEGVLQDDAAQVSKTAGSPVTESKMRYLRRQWTGSADTTRPSAVVLEISQNESQAASFGFASYTAGGKDHAVLNSDDFLDDRAVICVFKRNGCWRATVPYLMK